MEFGQKELDELLKYIQKLEKENQDLKSYMYMVIQQRNSYYRKIRQNEDIIEIYEEGIEDISTE